MKEIGIQKTQLDTTILHENIALSMADIPDFQHVDFRQTVRPRHPLSTVAFRGTSPSHTQVTWNGMRINSPMLGMTDFSMIPPTSSTTPPLLHGTSSVNEAGGGLGGAVKLSTRPADADGFQPASHAGCRLVFDFRRVFAPHLRQRPLANFDTRRLFLLAKRLPSTETIKNVLILDDDTTSSALLPIERNKSGACHHDFHALQEVYYNTGHGDRFGLQAWYVNSKRGLPDAVGRSQRENDDYLNQQREQTLRSILSWDHLRKKWKVGVKSRLYPYLDGLRLRTGTRQRKMEKMSPLAQLESTRLLRPGGRRILPREKWLFTATVSAHQHLVRSIDKTLSMDNQQPTGSQRQQNQESARRL